MARDGINDLKAPMYCDIPFTRQYPIPFPLDAFWVCPPCCPCTCPCFCMWLGAKMSMPKVRGIPRDAAPLHPAMEEELLAMLQGEWKIVALDKPTANQIEFTDVLVMDKQMILSGLHSPMGDPIHAARTQTQTMHFLAGPDGTLYVDHVGSVLKVLDFFGGEVVFDNGLGIQLLWQRPWKFQGLSPPACLLEIHLVWIIQLKGCVATKQQDGVTVTKESCQITAVEAAVLAPQQIPGMAN